MENEDNDYPILTHQKIYDILIEEFECLQKDGYIWEDKQGHKYKFEDITTSYLKNIITFAKERPYPDKQLQVLENELKRRLENGINKNTK